MKRKSAMPKTNAGHIHCAVIVPHFFNGTGDKAVCTSGENYSDVIVRIARA
jgi:hypothetical protein